MKIKLRQREIDVNKLENFRVQFGFTKVEIAELLEISAGQLNNYYKCGRVPANRYYGLLTGYINAINTDAEEKKQRAIDLLA